MVVETIHIIQTLGFGLLAAVGIWHGTDTDAGIYEALAVVCFGLGLGTVLLGLLLTAVLGNSHIVWIGLVHGLIGAVALLIVPLKELLNGIREQWA